MLTGTPEFSVFNALARALEAYEHYILGYYVGELAYTLTFTITVYVYSARALVREAVREKLKEMGVSLVVASPQREESL